MQNGFCGVPCDERVHLSDQALQCGCSSSWLMNQLTCLQNAMHVAHTTVDDLRHSTTRVSAELMWLENVCSTETHLISCHVLGGH
jgi:hypothetical protein